MKANSARETFIDWLGVAIGAVLACAVAGAIGLLVSIHAVRRVGELEGRNHRLEHRVKRLEIIQVQGDLIQ